MEHSQLECLFRSWGHSREEDGDGISVYRPAGFRFPPSRGRDWVEFRADGTVVFFGPGRDDSGHAVTRRWVDSGDGSLEIEKGQATGPHRLTIVQCNGSVLKVRWVDGLAP